MAVVLFLFISLIISFFIGSIVEGWRTMATIGAAFGIPALLRWFWWRVNADAEFMAIATGISAAAVPFFYLLFPEERSFNQLYPGCRGRILEIVTIV